MPVQKSNVKQIIWEHYYRNARQLVKTFEIHQRNLTSFDLNAIQKWLN